MCGDLVRIFCTTLFTNNNIKVVIQMHTFLLDHLIEFQTPIMGFESSRGKVLKISVNVYCILLC